MEGAEGYELKGVQSRAVLMARIYRDLMPGGGRGWEESGG